MRRRPSRGTILGARLRLSPLLRPGLRLLASVYALAAGLAWWLDDREMLHAVVAAPGWLCWIVAIAVWFGLIRAIAFVGVPMADDPVPAALEPYDAAWLSGGTWRMVAVAMAMQVQRGSAAITHDPRVEGHPPRSLWRVTREDAPAHAVERAVASVSREDLVDVREAYRAVRPLARDAGRRLRAAGLAEFRDAIPAWQLGGLLLCGAVLVFAAMRFIHSLDDIDHASPADFFLMLLAAGVVVFFDMPAGRTTASGTLALSPLRHQAQDASAARALALGKAAAAERAALAAQHPVRVMTLAVYADSAVVDDPRFDEAWHLWPIGALFDAWRGGGDVRSIHHVDSSD